MAAVTVNRTGRTWYGRPTYSVTLADPTGKISFHGCGHTEAERLALVLAPIVGARPVGALADILAREVLLHEPTIGEEWTAPL
jgi:hypothetical protein